MEVVANAQMLQSESARVATEVSNRMVEDLPVVVNGAVRSPFDLSATTAEVNSTGQYRVGGGKRRRLWHDARRHYRHHCRPVGLQRRHLDADQHPLGRRANGIQRDLRRLQSRGRPRLRRRHEFRFQVRHQPVPWRPYEFLRNQDLDAKGFYGATKPVYKQNDFGVTAGGPVWLPKVYHGKDKTFFFFSYEGFRNRAGATPTPYSVPPPEFYTGDLHNFVNASRQDVPDLRSGHHHPGERLIRQDPVSQ